MRYLATATIFLMCSTLSAQHVRIRTVIDESVNKSTYGYGSGCCIGKLQDGNYAILTAAHVVQDRLQVSVEWDTSLINAEVIHIKHLLKPPPAMDVALLSARLYGNVNRLKLSTEKQQSVTLHGYPGNLPFKSVRGVIHAKYHYQDIITTQPYAVSSGMSGGAVIGNGQLVGIISGRDSNVPTEAVQTSAMVIVPWLEKTLGYLPE